MKLNTEGELLFFNLFFGGGIMGTQAVIIVGDRFFWASHDGDPEAIVPELVSAIKEAKKLSKATGQSLLRVLAHLLYDDIDGWEPVNEVEAAGIAGYEYTVEEDGTIIVSGDVDFEDLVEEVKYSIENLQLTYAVDEDKEAVKIYFNYEVEKLEDGTPRRPITDYLDGKSALAKVYSDEGYVHVSWMLEDGSVISFEDIWCNYPRTSLCTWNSVEEYAGAISKVDWIVRELTGEDVDPEDEESTKNARNKLLELLKQ